MKYSILLLLSVSSLLRAQPDLVLMVPPDTSYAYRFEKASLDGNQIAFAVTALHSNKYEPRYAIFRPGRGDSMSMCFVQVDGGVADLDFHPSRPWLALVPMERTRPVQLYDFEKDSLLTSWPSLPRGDLYWHPGGQLLGVITGSGLVLFNTETQQVEWEVQVPDPDWEIVTFSFHPDGALGVLHLQWSDEKTERERIVLLDFMQKKTFLLLDERYKKEEAPYQVKVGFCPSGDLYSFSEMSYAGTTKCRFWSGGNFQTPRKLTLEYDATLPAISATGRYLAFYQYDGVHLYKQLRVMDIETQQFLQTGFEADQTTKHELYFMPGTDLLWIINNQKSFVFDCAKKERLPIFEPRDSIGSNPIWTGYRSNRGLLLQLVGESRRSSRLLGFDCRRRIADFAARQPSAAIRTAAAPAFPGASGWLITQKPKPGPDFHLVMLPAAAKVSTEEIQPEQTLRYESHRRPLKSPSGGILKYGVNGLLFSPDYRQFALLAHWQAPDYSEEVLELSTWDAVTLEPQRQMAWSKPIALESTPPELPFDFSLIDLQLLTVGKKTPSLNFGTDAGIYSADFRTGQIERLDSVGRKATRKDRAVNGTVTAQVVPFSPPYIEVSASLPVNLYTSDRPDATFIFVAFCHGDSLVAAIQHLGKDTDSSDGPFRLCIFDVQKKKMVAQAALGNSAVAQLEFLIGRRRLLTVQYDGTLKFWNLESFLPPKPTAAKVSEMVFIAQTGHGGSVKHLAFSPDGRWLASASEDRSVLIWDIATGLHFEPMATDEQVSGLAFTEDGRYLIVLGTLKTHYWDLNEHRLAQVFPGVSGAGYEPGSQLLISKEIENNDTLRFEGRHLPGNDPVFSFTLNISWIYDVLAVSPDGRRMALTSLDSILYIVSLPAGKIVGRHAYPGKILIGGAFDETGSRLALGFRDGWVRVVSVPKGRLVRAIYTGDKTSSSYWASGLRLRQRDLMSYVPIEEGNGAVWSLAIRDGKLITGGHFSNLAVWDLNTGALLDTFQHIDPQAPAIEAELRNLGYDREHFPFNHVNALACSPDGALLASGSDHGSIKIWRLATGDLLKTLTGRVRRLSSAVFHPTENILATSCSADYSDTNPFSNMQKNGIVADTAIRIWHLAPSLSLERMIGARGAVSHLTFNPRGDELTGWSGYYGLFTWDWPRRRLKAARNGGFMEPTYLEYAPLGDKIAVVQQYADSTTVLIYGNEAEKPGIRLQVPKSQQFHFAGKDAMFLDWFREEWQTASLPGGTLRPADAPPLLGPYLRWHDFFYDARTHTQWLGYTNGLAIWTERGGTKKIAEFPTMQAERFFFDPHARFAAVAVHEGPSSMLSRQNGLKLFALPEGREVFSTDLLSNEVTTGVTVSADGRLAAVASQDGFATLWHTQTGRPLLKLVADDRGEFVALTPDNYYWATKGAHNLVAFRLGQSLFAFDQFDLRYNRPDLVLAALGYAPDSLVQLYRRAWIKRLQKMNFTEDLLRADFQVPVVRLTEAIPLTVDANEISLSVEANDTVQLLERLQITVNDVPVFGRFGLDLRALETHRLVRKFTISLAPGANTIKISALNRGGGESIRERVDVSSLKPTLQPDLYVLAIGASRYADSTQNLAFADKDARDVAALFQDNPFKQYARVNIRILTNEQVRAVDILKAKAWLRQSRIQDHVVVFYAGHGLVDAELDYYLATWDVDFRRPEQSGLSYDALESLLDSLPARQKALLIDACFSGEIDKESVALQQQNIVEEGNIKFRTLPNGNIPVALDYAGAFDLMQVQFVDLRLRTGAAVLASAGALQAALEGKDWQNGIFTFALIQGLRTCRADTNGDKAVTISELQDWLASEVPRLTGGRQKPVVRSENISHNWRIW